MGSTTSIGQLVIKVPILILLYHVIDYAERVEYMKANTHSPAHETTVLRVNHTSIIAYLQARRGSDPPNQWSLRLEAMQSRREYVYIISCNCQKIK